MIGAIREAVFAFVAEHGHKPKTVTVSPEAHRRLIGEAQGFPVLQPREERAVGEQNIFGIPIKVDDELGEVAGFLLEPLSAS